MSLTFTDIFCGAGGSSLGLAAAGMQLKLAANHWARAIETHAANFDAEHLCADVNNYDMRRLPTTDVLWASPICTESSPAGRKGRRRGGRQVPGQGDLLQAHGHVSQAGMDRTRATFHDVIRAAEVHRYPVVLVENVPEVADEWELFDWWVEGMCRLSYHVQYVSVSSAHIGEPGNPHAPQWRDRLYLVFTRVGIRLPDVAPRPLAWCAECRQDVDAVQAWRDPAARRIGRYRRQYDYRCPHARCRHAIVEPYVRPAASAIDWTHLGERIGNRRRPLAANTLRRIEAGLRMFAQPVMVNSNHDDDRVHPADGMPLPSRTTKIGDGLACPPGAFYVKNYGGHADPRHMAKPVSDPFGTITAADHHGLVVPYYRTGKAKPTGDPFDTVTSRDRFALVTGETLRVADCHYRMLQPRESLRAQRFPDSYIVHGNQGEQTMQAGNAVSANVAQWLGQRIATALDSPGAAT